MKTQKLIGILGICVLYACTGYAQDMIGKNLKAYEGTWQYANATDTFTLVLKEDKTIDELGKIDCLYGLHYYKKNGVVIDDYLAGVPKQNNWTFRATNAVHVKYSTDNINPNKLGALYRDNNKQRDKRMRGRFDLNPNNPKEMTWTLTQKEREVLYLGEAPPPQDMSSTIPKTMVLKKIK